MASSFVAHLSQSFRHFMVAPQWGRFLGLMVMGMPVGLIFVFILNTLQFWLNSYHLSKATIGIFAFAVLPSAFKFIWAPFLDYLSFPILDRFLPKRYAWAVGLCLIHCCVLSIIAQQTPSEDYGVIFILIMMCSLASASLEINIDAIRIELMPKSYQGYATSVYALGYRLGTILGGMGILYVSEYYGWKIAFGMIIGLLALSACVIAVCGLKLHQDEDVDHSLPAVTSEGMSSVLHQALKKFQTPFLSFMHSHHWILVFVFIFSFRLGDNFINNMSNIFYLSLGFTQLDIANVVKFFGVFMTIFGTFLGGYLVMRRGDITTMIISGILHVASNIMYVVMCFAGRDEALFYFSVAVENATGGMVTTAFVAYLSNLCKKPYTASHYALFSSLWYLSTACSGFGGILAEALSWKSFFVICISLGILPLCLLFYLKRHPLDQSLSA